MTSIRVRFIDDSCSCDITFVIKEYANMLICNKVIDNCSEDEIEFDKLNDSAKKYYDKMITNLYITLHKILLT